ncbi:MAG: TetR/AcrR family transcriptional regulator [Myxococcales bacterium]|nr:TetR/AcrR family transcriptional regulator [Myxococcales bacterium]
MPRPARYDTDTILDAALAEFDAVGARGLSVAGVARALGAPSGSLYHRFPSRDALIGTLWLRAAEGFQAGYLQRLAADRPAIDCAVDGALHVLRWSRARPVEARLLVVYRWQDLVAPEWPEEIATRARATAAALDEGLRGIAARLLPEDPEALLRVRWALTSIPYSAVRPGLADGRPIPPALDAMVERAVRAVLLQGAERGA